MNNKNRNNSEEGFLSEASQIARNRESSEGFLSDLVNLANSEEYADIDFSAELEEELAESVTETPSVAWNNPLIEDFNVPTGNTSPVPEEIPTPAPSFEPEPEPFFVPEPDAPAPEPESAEEALKRAEEELFEAELALKKAEAESADDDDFGDETDEDEEEPVKKKKKNGISYYIAMAICIGVFIYSVGKLANYFYTGYKYRKDMDKLSEVVGDISADVVIKEPDTPEIFFPDEQVYVASSANYVDEISDDWKNKYATLVEMNPDCVGWIKIPDTNINYPVMYTPGDYEYYLRRDFEKKHLMRGLPFLAEGTQLNVSQNTLIYGHNMNDGTAFGNLRNYLDQSYADAHKYCYFYTAYNQGVYQLMDVVITKIYNTEDTCFKYYMYSDVLDQKRFETYVYYMDKMSSFDTGVDAVWGDQLISLSTCYKRYDKENGRLVLVFKRIQ